MKVWLRLLLLIGSLLPLAALADPGFAALKVEADPNGGETWSISLQVLALMTALSFLPAGLMMMTSFTRIIIVLAILRQAIGTMQTPSNQILVGLALFLSFFIMVPVFDDVYDNAVQPYMNEELPPADALQRAADISRTEPVESDADVPFSLLLPAFVTSELKTAFQIGFLILIPFLVIDLVVASLLMSMGMMMLSPMIISLPFKIMLFVLIDGWTLVMGTLASSFFV
jgi:flagellar biosynthetic protein FliP